MTPSLRALPITTATWNPLRRAWLVALPGGIGLEARTEAGVAELARKHATGSAVRYVRPSQTSPGTQPAQAGH